MLAFHNGRFVPYSELHIPAHDAGFVFGATVTDFCRTYAHKLFRWPDHLTRLRRDAEACFIPLPYSDAELSAAAERLVTENTKGLPPGDDLALITFATPGPLGYMVGEAANGPPTVAMHTFSIPKERYRKFFTEGVVLEFGGHFPNFNDLSVGVKHRSRVHWWTASQETKSPFAVPLLTGRSGMPDTAIGAVLGVQDGRVLAPPPDTVLNSISVQVVEELCSRLDIPFQHSPNWLLTGKKVVSDEWLLVGSAFGIVGVKTKVGVRGARFDFPWPGPVFTRLAAAWSELVGVDIVRQFVG